VKFVFDASIKQSERTESCQTNSFSYGKYSPTSPIIVYNRYEITIERSCDTQ